jgi:hypothetical protein
MLSFSAMEMILNCNAASIFPGGYHENKKTSNFQQEKKHR